MNEARARAARAYLKAYRTGEHSAAAAAAPHLAPDVVLVGGRQDCEGHDEVLKRITGQWPNTPVYLHASWSDPEEVGDALQVHADISGLGAAPAAVKLTFGFNNADQISRVEQEITPQAPPQQTNRLPDFAKAMVNNALANGTPMTVAYVDAEGRPVLSLRGSTQAFSDDQLAIWLRNAQSGIVKALETNPNISLLYRDQKSRSTLIFQGRGRIATDEATRRRVWESSSEIEQNHDPSVQGAALIVDLDRVGGGTPYGGVRLVRE